MIATSSWLPSGPGYPQGVSQPTIRRRMYLSEARSRLKRGDTVRLPDGSTGKVLNTPTHYDRADGYPLLGGGYRYNRTTAFLVAVYGSRTWSSSTPSPTRSRDSNRAGTS